jgi:phosphate transport system permease protein
MLIVTEVRAETATLGNNRPGPFTGVREADVASGEPEGFNLNRRLRLGESMIQGFLFLCGAVSILTTIGIIYVLGRESWLFFGSPEVSLGEFFSSTSWRPSNAEFGIWPLVTATLLTSVVV